MDNAQNEFQRVVRLLTIEGLAETPASVAAEKDTETPPKIVSRVRYRQRILGFMWSQSVGPRARAKLCWKLPADELVTCSNADTAAVAYTVALAWAARNGLDESFFE